MSILKEFREFAVKGNVVDLAVGVVIGAAFGKIVSSLVADVVMPPLGLAIGGLDFKQFHLTLRDAVDEKTPAVILEYGKFIQNIFDFLIVAWAIFLLIKVMNRAKRRFDEKTAAQAALEPAPPPSRQEALLEEIRDLLKTQTIRALPTSKDAPTNVG
jgi:large conductance mechanosensitive channel